MERAGPAWIRAEEQAASRPVLALVFLGKRQPLIPVPVASSTSQTHSVSAWAR
jgi:hypothetical protein